MSGPKKMGHCYVCRRVICEEINQFLWFDRPKIYNTTFCVTLFTNIYHYFDARTVWFDNDNSLYTIRFINRHTTQSAKGESILLDCAIICCSSNCRKNYGGYLVSEAVFFGLHFSQRFKSQVSE